VIPRELRLDRIEQGRGDDRRMLGRIARSLVVELATIDPVPEDVRERPIGQGHPSNNPAVTVCYEYLEDLGGAPILRGDLPLLRGRMPS
jgi:hypothetical protein